MVLAPSTIVIVAVWPFTPALPAVAVPLMATPAAASLLLMMLSPATGLVIAMVGAVSSTVIAWLAVVAALPALSDTFALMLYAIGQRLCLQRRDVDDHDPAVTVAV